MALNETFLFAHRVNFAGTYDIRNKHRLFPYTALPGFVPRQGKKIFSLLQSVQADSGAHPAPYSMCTFVRMKWPEHDFNHSPQSSTEVEKEWSCTSASRVCLHGLDQIIILNVA
jgi:hypothetical protein